MARGWLNRIVDDQKRDPDIGKFNKLWQGENLKDTDLAALAGLSISTVKNLFVTGKTKRPQHLTFLKLAGAMGHEYGLRRITKVDYQEEIPKAREEYKAHKARLAKQRQKKGNGKTP